MRITKRNLRSLIQETLITEITKLPKEYFKAIDNAIMASKFWKEPNSPNDDMLGEYDAGYGRTPAADSLEKALQGVYDELGLDIKSYVSSYVTDEEDMLLHPDHPAYPNRWLIDARWYVSKQEPGQNVIDLQVMVGDPDLGFDPNDVDPPALVRNIAQTIRHELVHYNQMKKQASSKGGLSDTEAFEEMLNDPKQIPDSERGTTQDYLRSHIEIDAHAHDGAEELLAVYGEEGAMKILRGDIDLSDPKLPNAITHYHDILPDDDATLHKLYSKMYTYIQYFLEE